MNNLISARKLEIARKLWLNDVSYLIFNVTNRCNAFCDHCFNWKKVQAAGVTRDPNQISRRPELSLSEIEKLTKSLPQLLLLNLCGGEPFLRLELPEIIALFSKNSKVNYVTLPTNGFLTELIPQQVEKICRQNPNIFFRISISIDGPAEAHDKIRRHPGGFEKAMNTAEELGRLKRRLKNFSVGAATVFSTDTQEHIDGLIETLYETGYFDIFNILHIRGQPRDFDLTHVDLAKYAAANKRLESFGNFKRHPSNYLLGGMHSETIKKVIAAQATPEKRVFKCYAGQKLLVIDDIGDVYPCEILEDRPLGNIRDHDYDIRALLQTKQSQETVQFIKDKKCACSWECAINAGWLFNFFTAPRLALAGFKSYLRDI